MLCTLLSSGDEHVNAVCLCETRDLAIYWSVARFISFRSWFKAINMFLLLHVESHGRTAQVFDT